TARRGAADDRPRDRGGRLRVRARAARLVAATLPHLRRPRRARYARPLPRVDAEARRARARGLRGSRRTGRRHGPARRAHGARRVTVVQPQLDLAFDEDATTRAAIVGDLHETLFVEAGAGSGKTQSLVD